MDGVNIFHTGLGPMVGLYLAFSAVFLVATAWALIEAIRARTWRWAITIVVLQPFGAFAWFAAGRRFYRQPVKPRGGWVTEAPSARHHRGE